MARVGVALVVIALLGPHPSTVAQSPPPPAMPVIDLAAYDNLRRYDLGTTTLTQQDVAAEFTTMPLPLTGVIGQPTGTDPFPLVVILHGRHGGCHFDGQGPSQWPCPPGTETRYDLGLAYLAQALTEAGYGVLVPNLNAAFSDTFGATSTSRNTLADQRSQQIIDAHLTRLAAASQGEAVDFGVVLAGPNRLDKTGPGGSLHGRGSGGSEGAEPAAESLR
jgi:hypothetical protein